MSNVDDADFRQRIIAAVQAELDRHAAVVLSESQQLRDEATKARDRMERSLSGRLDELSSTIEQLRLLDERQWATATEREDRLAEREREIESALETVRTSLTQRIDALSSAAEQAELRRDEAERALRDRVHGAVESRSELIETRIQEAESRANRRIEQVTAELDALVEMASRPLFDTVRDQLAALARKVDGFATDLRTFDEQAARMVTFFSELSGSIEQRVEQLSQRIDENVASRIAGLDRRIEDAMALSLRQHVETNQRVNERTDRIEERMNQRAFAYEDKLKQESGQRIAEIDAHVGRVTQGLDTTLEALTERLTRIESSIAQFGGRLDEAREEFRSIDAEAIEEMKQKMSTAVGEATLVRIEMDRFEKLSKEQADQMLVRMVAIESELAATTMDVETAVQLERLEELERAVMEFDPTKFVLKESARSADGSNRSEHHVDSDHET